jgi:cyclic 2,3-diphosphoglycerate synthetase
VSEGARLAAALDPELVVFDGSGAALPPVAVARRLLVVGANQDRAVTTGYLNAYRLRLADLVVVGLAEEGSGHRSLADALRRLAKPDVAVVSTVLRPQPAEPVAGRAVAYFCTAPPSEHARLAAHLAEAYGAAVVHVSGNLADRAALRAELPGVDAEVFLVELKAAAIDVVAEEAVVRGARTILAANAVVPLAGEPDLDAEVRRLAEEALAA